MYNDFVKWKGVRMNIKSVDNQNFQSRNDKSLATYNPRRDRRHHVDSIIALDDNSVRKLAYLKTIDRVEDDKHRKITKGLFASIPFVAGLATAILQPAQSKFLSKNLSGVSARLLNGAKSSAIWGALLGTGFGIYAVKDKLEEKFSSFDKFSYQNPFLTFAGCVAAFSGALALGGKYIPQLSKNIAKHINPASITKFENGVLKSAKKFNDLSFVKTIQKQAHNLKTSKLLAPFADVVKSALDWMPSMLLAGAGLHAFNHSQVRNHELIKNYSEMKDYQMKLARARIRELSLQNDFLLQDAQNREDLKLLKTPMADLPQEIIEKVETVIENQAV